MRRIYAFHEVRDQLGYDKRGDTSSSRRASTFAGSLLAVNEQESTERNEEMRCIYAFYEVMD